jgi:Tfp pilus assembly protein PilF
MISCDEAIKINPNYALAWFNRAGIYALKREKEKSLSDLKRAIELNSSLKENARKDKSFENFWNDEDFKKIVE